MVLAFDVYAVRALTSVSIIALLDEDVLLDPVDDDPPIGPMPPGGGPEGRCDVALDELDDEASSAFMFESTDVMLLVRVARLLSPLVDDDDVELLDADFSAVRTDVRPLSMSDLD